MNTRQDINLYQEVAIHKRSLLSARDTLLATVCIAIALLAIWTFGYVQVRKLSRDVAMVHDMQSQQQTQMQAALQAAAVPEVLEAVQARVDGLKAQVDARTAALKALQSGSMGPTQGFAPRLEALARQHVDGLWLERMVLDLQADQLSLSGKTIEPQLISSYLHSLSHDPALTGMRFEEFVVERMRSESDAQVVQFRASSPGQAPRPEDKS